MVIVWILYLIHIACIYAWYAWFSAYFRLLAEGHLGVNHRPLSWCQRPDMDANTNPGVQRYGRQSLWPACAAELLSSETRHGNHWGDVPQWL